MNSSVTRYSLLAGAAYFVCMALAHYFSFKVPVLFVYYDVPFYAYQDRIISFAVVAYVCLFYSAASHRVVVPAALLTLATTVVGLGALNVSTALGQVLAGRTTGAYWAQTAMIAGYLAWLLFWYYRDGRRQPRPV